MIHSASSSSASRSNAASATAAGTVSKGPLKAGDQVHIDKAALLRAGLQQVPEIRPEVVDRARALAADPAYPSAGIIAKISAAIVNSPDLTEEQP